MCESKGTGTGEKEESQTIRIEVPGGACEGMKRMMSAFMGSSATPKGCCDSDPVSRCAQPDDTGSIAFEVILKRKE